ncbi:MAG: acetate kinase [Cyanobacteria bacterium P01_F01_bin.150]
MNILVLNAGSSSHKLCLYSIEAGLPDAPLNPDWNAQIDWYPQRQEAVFKVETRQGHKLNQTVEFSSKREILLQVLKTLWHGDARILDAPTDIDMVGHRVVHGGETYRESVVVTEEVKEAIAHLSPLAPSHNPVNLEGIKLMENLLGDIPQVAVFDTAFHRQMPEVATTYPGPYEWIEQGIQRYGFHGISHQYCTQRAAQLLGKDMANLRLIICHLGNGGSLTAVKNGHSVDTTMGFTPLDGLMMGTRSGAVDPGILIHLMRQGYSADQLDQMLNKESGLKGISGVSHDLREIGEAIRAPHRKSNAKGTPRAILAQNLYLHRLKSCIGSMLMSLGGLDAIVFTAGIGEHSTTIRAAVCDAMAFLEVRLDRHKNNASPVDQDIATQDSNVRVLVVRTQEDWAIAQDCWALSQSS